MGWREINAEVGCRFCGARFLFSFYVKGLTPCCSYNCGDCGACQTVSPPGINEEVCAECLNRIDCLTLPQFEVFEFTITGSREQYWSLDSGHPAWGHRHSTISDFKALRSPKES